MNIKNVVCVTLTFFIKAYLINFPFQPHEQTWNASWFSFRERQHKFSNVNYEEIQLNINWIAYTSSSAENIFINNNGLNV